MTYSPLAKVLGACSHVPLFTSSSRPNRSGFTGFFQLGTLLSSTGGQVWNRLWEQQESLFMLLIFIFLCQKTLLFSKKSRNASSFFFSSGTCNLTKTRVSSNVSINWAWDCKDNTSLHILKWVFFAICLIIFVGRIQTTDLLHPTPSCHLLPCSALLVRGQAWTGSTHVWACCRESLFILALKLVVSVNNIPFMHKRQATILVFPFYNLYAVILQTQSSVIEWFYWYFLNQIPTNVPWDFLF